MNWGYQDHFDPGLLKLYWVKGASTLGTSCIIGQANLSQVDDTRTDVPISSLTISDGYQIGDMGELSLDPATGTATFVEYVDDATPGRTNLLSDNQASMETDISEWAASYPATTTIARSTAWAPYGNASILVAATSVVSGQTGTLALKFYLPKRPTYGTPNLTFSGTAKVDNSSTTSAVNVRAEIVWYDRSTGTPVEVGHNYGPVTTVNQDDAGTLVYVTGSAPATYSSDVILIMRFQDGSYSVGSKVLYDGFLYENNSQPAPFHLGYEPSTRLEVRDRIEVAYGSSVIFQGVVTEAEVVVEASQDAVRQGYTFQRHASYTLRSFAAQLLDTLVNYTDLPAETAIARARRYFTISTAALNSSELSAVNAVQAPEISGTGSMRLIDVIRNFTEQTLYPLRIVPSLPVSWTSLEVVSAGQLAGVYAPEWARTITWKADDTSGGVLYPTDVTVQTDNVQFFTGTTEMPVTVSKIGAFSIGAGRIGSSYDVNSGFQPGTRIDIFGDPMVVSRITITFGNTAQTALEMAVPIH
jgi:hypothetical protein